MNNNKDIKKINNKENKISLLEVLIEKLKNEDVDLSGYWRNNTNDEPMFSFEFKIRRGGIDFVAKALE